MFTVSEDGRYRIRMTVIFTTVLIAVPFCLAIILFVLAYIFNPFGLS